MPEPLRPSTPALFDVDVEDLDAAVLVAPRGELDIATVPRLEAALARTEGRPVVVLDLAGLSFIDSSGLRAVIATARRCRAAGRRLLVVQGDPAVQRIFAVTALEGLLEPLADREAALRVARSGAAG